MNAYKFAAILGWLLSSSTLVLAAEECGPADFYGNRVCVAGIPTDKVGHVQAIQGMSQWCWAATISMAFKFYGYNVPQKQIVQETFGGIVNLPAQNGQVLTSALNREWVDTTGRKFSVSASAYDLTSGQLGVNNQTVVDELSRGRPLIVGTQGHAMLVTAIQYVKTPLGLGPVLGVTVRDPWPGRGRRQLSLPELFPIYLATVDIGSLSSSDKESPDTADDTDRWSRCYDRCQATESACTDRCPSGSTWEKCYDRCQSRFNSCTDRCGQQRGSK